MHISIIIPTLNEEQEIGGLIRELRDRAEGDIYQVIVADGGSGDRTAEIASGEGAEIVACRKRGRAAQLNEGAEAASGELLYFLHADTVPPPGFDRLITQAITGGAGAGCFQLRFTSSHPALRFYGWCTRFNFTLLRFGDQSLFVKPELFDRVGRFDEELIVMEDQQIVRDLKKLAPFKVLNQAVLTSARKYEDNGALRLQLIFTMILVLYYFGASQKMLAHLYNSLIDS